MSHHEQVLSALFGLLQAISLAGVKRNDSLPQSVPAAGLVILRDGELGEPDVKLNPRRGFCSHRAKIEAYVTQRSAAVAKRCSMLCSRRCAALAADRSLGGLAEKLCPRAEVAAAEGQRPRSVRPTGRPLGARLRPPMWLSVPQ